MKYIISIVFLFEISFLIGQSCNCPNYEDRLLDKIDRYRESRDSINLEASLRSLESVNNPFCTFQALFERVYTKVKDKKNEDLSSLIEKVEMSAKKLSCPSATDPFIWQLKAEYFQKKDSIELAMQYAFKLYEWGEKNNNDKFLLVSIAQLSTLFSRQEQYENIKPFVKIALAKMTSMKPSQNAAKYYNWLARIFETQYTLNEQRSGLDSAKVFANKALNLAIQYDLPKQRQYAYQALEAISYHNGDFGKSLSFHDSTYKYMLVTNAYDQVPIYFQTKALTLLELGRLGEASIHQDSAIYYARKYSQQSFLANILKEGSAVYESIGEQSKALVALKEFALLKEKLVTEQRTTIINDLEKKYQKEKQENTIMQLKNQKSLLWLGLLLLSLASLAVFYWYRQRDLKQKQVIMETEQRLNRARMNPHFFFNALASLQSFAINETDSILLAENLSKFSHIMRETLENTYREYVTIDQEESFLREYVELQQLRYPEKFDFELALDSALDTENLLIPSMIVQPFIENCIEHGFADLSYKGKLKITFSSDTKGIKIIVLDNGKGLNYQSEQAKPYISRASQIIKDRIYLLNMKLKSEATFSIVNNPTQGVTVIIKLPLIYEN